MSKPSVYAASPFGSRPASPPLGTPIDKDEDKQALMMGDLSRGANSSAVHGAKRQDAAETTMRDQAGPILAYCGASIMMTVVNKYVVSGAQFTMNFLLLAIQSAVCVLVVVTCKRMGLITFRDFDKNDAKAWFPVSTLLVIVIYTGSKSLQFLSIPVYTIFKNLTIILIAYGEVFMFGASVTGLTLVSFALMVGSSIIAAWSDIRHAVTSAPVLDPITGLDIAAPAHTIGGVNIGYIWMALNCFASAAYVLYMRKRIKITGFKDWDSMMYNNIGKGKKEDRSGSLLHDEGSGGKRAPRKCERAEDDVLTLKLLSIPVLVIASVIIEDWGTASLTRNFPPDNRNILLFAIAFSGAAAVFISYTTAWCVRVCGSTTYSMVGALNKLPVAASGMLFFGDPANFGNVTAIGVGGVAGLVYAVAKTNQAKVEKARAALGGKQ